MCLVPPPDSVYRTLLDAGPAPSAALRSAVLACHHTLPFVAASRPVRCRSLALSQLLRAVPVTAGVLRRQECPKSGHCRSEFEVTRWVPALRVDRIHVWFAPDSVAKVGQCAAATQKSAIIESERPDFLNQYSRHRLDVEKIFFAVGRKSFCNTIPPNADIGSAFTAGVTTRGNTEAARR